MGHGVSPWAAGRPGLLKAATQSAAPRNTCHPSCHRAGPHLLLNPGWGSQAAAAVGTEQYWGLSHWGPRWETMGVPELKTGLGNAGGPGSNRKGGNKASLSIWNWTGVALT